MQTCFYNHCIGLGGGFARSTIDFFQYELQITGKIEYALLEKNYVWRRIKAKRTKMCLFPGQALYNRCKCKDQQFDETN